MGQLLAKLNPFQYLGFSAPIRPAEPVVNTTVDYSALSREEIAYVDPEVEALMKRSRVVSVKGESW